MTLKEYYRREKLTEAQYYKEFVEGGWSGLELQSDFARSHPEHFTGGEWLKAICPNAFYDSRLNLGNFF